MDVLKKMLSHIFPCNSNKNEATNKKYTSNERKFYIFYEKIPKLDDRGFRASKIDTLHLGNFLQFFSTNLENIENINYFIFLYNSNEN